MILQPLSKHKVNLQLHKNFLLFSKNLQKCDVVRVNPTHTIEVWSLRYELCSDKCWKQQDFRNKREFDEKSRNNGYDHQYKNEFSGWRNVMNKAKKSPEFPPERLAAMQEAFEAFKKETLRQKSISWTQWKKHNLEMDTILCQPQERLCATKQTQYIEIGKYEK